MLKKKLRNQKGFTLIEIIAVLVILGILAAVAIPKFLDLQNDARQAAIKGAFAAAKGNVNAAYASWLIKGGSTNATITTGPPAYIGTAPNTVALSSDLGDFSASYSATTGATPRCTVTIAAGTTTSWAVAPLVLAEEYNCPWHP